MKRRNCVAYAYFDVGEHIYCCCYGHAELVANDIRQVILLQPINGIKGQDVDGGASGQRWLAVLKYKRLLINVFLFRRQLHAGTLMLT